MWRRLSDWLYRISNGWVVLSALIIFLLFIGLVMPGQASQAVARGAASPDLTFYYTAGDLYKMAEAYGAAGRQAYVRVRFTFDLIFPLVYLLFLCTGISWIYGRVFPPDSVSRLANLAPVLAAAFDYLENLSASLVMARYPVQTPVVDRLAAVFTMTKWVLVSGSIALLLAGVVVRIWLWVRGRGRQ